METPVIDGTDRAILDELRHDARLTWRELGERIGLGPTATADRVRRLEQIGVLRGYHAEVDLSVLGMGLRASTSSSPLEGCADALTRHTPTPQLLGNDARTSAVP